ncbi:hypothetical protein [Actinosynnema sp. NPDC020468]|uniref:hypothetical protein n=1 Tax=Actinosynnema sp. NPDC020468 TaxID=3154488 RepID=UPI003410FC32
MHKMIMPRTPRREWLLRCEGPEDEVFTLTVARGAVEVHPPEDYDCVHLELSQIAEFRAALDEAVAQAESDLRARAGLPPALTPPPDTTIPTPD